MQDDIKVPDHTETQLFHHKKYADRCICGLSVSSPFAGRAIGG